MGVHTSTKFVYNKFVSSCRVFVKHSRCCYSENIGMQPGILPRKWRTQCIYSHRYDRAVIYFGRSVCSYCNTDLFSYWSKKNVSFNT